ncbi:MAG: hypothetical protein ACRDJE_05795 [Dehalococcoidia bacterium]
MPFEFGFDVVRVDVDELETDPGEPREFVIEALAGDVAAHISTDLAGLTLVLDEILREERRPDYRPGRAWEPQLPQMRGFFFHPRVVLIALQAIAPHADDDDDVDFWEFVIDDDEGSQVILRMSETTTRSLVRRIHDLIGDVIA